MQRQVLYLGELNDDQRAGWVRTIEAVSGKEPQPRQLALFPDDREPLPIPDCETVRVRLDKIELVGIVFMGYAGTGRILEDASAVKPEGNKLAEYAEGAYLLPVDRSGERISFPS